jgi:hypothetical protein
VKGRDSGKKEAVFSAVWLDGFFADCMVILFATGLPIFSQDHSQLPFQFRKSPLEACPFDRPQLQVHQGCQRP